MRGKQDRQEDLDTSDPQSLQGVRYDTAASLGALRILDLADQKGLYCTKLLADLGADVVKVERPGGDATRDIGPFWHNTVHPEMSLYFLYHNTNKRGITLDLEKPDGAEIFKELVLAYKFYYRH